MRKFLIRVFGEKYEKAFEKANWAGIKTIKHIHEKYLLDRGYKKSGKVYKKVV